MADLMIPTGPSALSSTRLSAASTVLLQQRLQDEVRRLDEALLSRRSGPATERARATKDLLEGVLVDLREGMSREHLHRLARHGIVASAPPGTPTWEWVGTLDGVIKVLEWTAPTHGGES